jgi:metal-responsive CopG/Arc/MetJ family transcriptional regulator
MTRDEITIPLNIPTGLVEKLDMIANQKYMKREDIIIDALAYYCQFYDMNNERLPETTRNIFYNLARYDDEFRKILRQAIREDPGADNQK